MHSIPVNLLDLSPEEFKKFLDSFDHVFSDCDGKLHHFLKTYILVCFQRQYVLISYYKIVCSIQ